MIRVRFVLEFAEVSAPRAFCSVDGGVEIADGVHYAVGFGPIGELVRRAWVAPRLALIFEHRQRTIVDCFEPAAAAAVDA